MISTIIKGLIIAVVIAGGGLWLSGPGSLNATADGLMRLIVEKGPDLALAEAKKIIDRRGFDDGSCHVIMHRLGRSAYRHFGNMEEALGSGEVASGVCSAGYVHGVLEAYFSETSDPVAAAPAACERYRNVNMQLFGNCTHGFGHGFMFYTNNDLPKALEMCDQLREGQSACAGGVFMENFNASKSTGHETEFSKLDDLFYPCAEQASYRDQCYFYSADHFLIYHPKQYQSLITWCEGASDEEFVGECIIRAGNRAFQDNYPDEKIAPLACSMAPEYYKGKCFEGIARAYKYFFNSTDKAKEFCRVTLDPNYRKYCPAQYQ